MASLVYVRPHISLVLPLAVTVLALSGLPVSAATGSEPCTTGQYLDEQTGNCLDCSVCEINHIIRRPCSAYSDTVCGLFYEFGHFQQAPPVPDPERNTNPEDGKNPDQDQDLEDTGKVETLETADDVSTQRNSSQDKGKQLCDTMHISRHTGTPL